MFGETSSLVGWLAKYSKLFKTKVLDSDDKICSNIISVVCLHENQGERLEGVGLLLFLAEFLVFLANKIVPFQSDLQRNCSIETCNSLLELLGYF